MTTYQIELADRSTVRLIKDDNAKAARPFDGGHIFCAPEAYPARICISTRCNETWQRGPNTDRIVDSEEEWKWTAAAYLRGEFAA